MQVELRCANGNTLLCWTNDTLEGDEMERREGVIVVGAGPVGFLTALGLARNGIPVTLLEAEAQINDSPRAAVYFPTTVKILERLGLLADAIAIGLKSWTFTFRVPSTGTVVAVDNRLATDDRDNAYNLHFGQHILARLVMQHLERLPHTQIRWNTRVVGLKQDAKSVTVTADTRDGPIELQADWVIGTDGGRSAVRHLLGLPFEGHTWPERFVATNLFYDFNLDEVIPESHLLRRLDVFVTTVLADLHEQLRPFYSDIGRPSVDPELMMRMLIVGYCYGIRHERKLCEEVKLHLAYRWFCRLDLDDRVPHHSTFSENRLNRFRESDLLRHIFERVVMACMAQGLVKGEGFAVDASVMEANASRYRGKAPDEIDWAQSGRQSRAVAEYLASLEHEEPNPDRKSPKVISLSDPSSAWTAKANKRVQFGYGLNYLIDIENAVIIDVEATPARTYDE